MIQPDLGEAQAREPRHGVNDQIRLATSAAITPNEKPPTLVGGYASGLNQPKYYAALATTTGTTVASLPVRDVALVTMERAV